MSRFKLSEAQTSEEKIGESEPDPIRLVTVEKATRRVFKERRTLLPGELFRFKTELAELCARYRVDLLSDGGHGALHIMALNEGESPDSVIGAEVY